LGENPRKLSKLFLAEGIEVLNEQAHLEPHSVKSLSSRGFLQKTVLNLGR